jgi:hypothetical protein
MRDYSVITPTFWIGETGKLLRGDANAQVLAMYLMSSPHSTMTGVFHCPVLYMAHETGIGMEGATKALARLSEVGFCEYDEASETVFVVKMASFQIAESLKPGDNRIIGLKRELSKMAPAAFKAKFLAIYSVAFCLGDVPADDGEKGSPSKAPPKPRTRTGTGTRLPSLSVPDCPHTKILDAFAEQLAELAQPIRSLWMDSKNATALKARWEWLLTACHETGKRKGERMATTEAEGVEWFARFFGYVSKSDYLMGRKNDWQADLIWLVNKSNFEKVLQGSYENQKAAA